MIGPVNGFGCRLPPGLMWLDARVLIEKCYSSA